MGQLSGANVELARSYIEGHTRRLFLAAGQKKAEQPRTATRVRYGRRSCTGCGPWYTWHGGLAFKGHTLTYRKIEYKYLTVSLTSFKYILYSKVAGVSFDNPKL